MNFIVLFKSILIEKTIYSENVLNDLIKKGYEQSKKFTWKKCAEETLKQYQNLA